MLGESGGGATVETNPLMPETTWNIGDQAEQVGLLPHKLQ